MTDDLGEDAELEAALGFEPVVSATGVDPSAPPAKPARPRARRTRLRRRLGAAAVLVGALGTMGGVYAAFASSSGAANSAEQSTVARGQQLYSVSCITCHGANLQGVLNRGPSLVGVGSAATYFQVSTGRMPLPGQGPYAERKPDRFDEADTRALATYVQSIGGGPQLPAGSLRGPDSSIAEGGELFRLNCASCHGTTFAGAPLSAGKIAPGLHDASDAQIFTAMLSGPENMPVFSNNQITVAQKKAIVSYIQTLKASNDPGGAGIDRIGPVSEAIVIWVAGIGVLIVVIMWIGAKAQ